MWLPASQKLLQHLFPLGFPAHAILVKTRFHEDEQEAWRRIGEVIKEKGDISRVDAGLVYFETVKADSETLKRNFSKRLKYLVDNGALKEEAVEKINREKLRRYRLE